MQIIPVLDLSKGLVVHAKNGNRSHYRPIQSSLCPSANPVEIVHSYLELHCFQKLYIADLDAIEHQGDNSRVIQKIISEFPELEIWLDTGLSLISLYLNRLNCRLLRIILSTESMLSASTFSMLRTNYRNHQFLLSVDFRTNTLIGSQEIIQDKGSWPPDVVVLNLDHVGTCMGVDFPTIPNQHDLFEKHNIFYGGGIRNYADLLQLEKIGAAGALLSTALHKKSITKNELQKFNR